MGMSVVDDFGGECWVGFDDGVVVLVMVVFCFCVCVDGYV